MTRKLMLPLLASAGMLAVGAPAAQSATLASKVGTLAGKVAGIQKSVNGLIDEDKGQNAAIDRVNNRVDTVVKNLSPVLAALPTVQTALTALADPVTGLRALNLARPKFVALETQSTLTPPQTGVKVLGSTPEFKGARYVGTDGGGNFYYLIDMGTKITDRAPLVSVLTPSATSDLTPTITPCGVSSDTINFCNGKVGAGTASDSNAILTSEVGPSDAAKIDYSVVFIAG